jgi:chemotaxis protein methyltransferase CheR
VILCRNTLIYFTLSLQEKILRNLAASLRPGGFLVLGQVERLIGPARKELRCVLADANIFQKHPFSEEESHAH